MATSPDPPHLCLIVDDDEAMRFLLRHHLESDGATVVEAASGDQARDVIKRQEPPFALVVSDNRMPGEVTGLDVLSAAAARDGDTALLLLTAHVDPELVRSAQALGAETLDKVDLPDVPRRWRSQAQRRRA